MAKVYKFNSDKIDDIKEYDSITDIAKELHVSREHLSSIIHGKKTYKLYTRILFIEVFRK